MEFYTILQYQLKSQVCSNFWFINFIFNGLFMIHPFPLKDMFMTIEKMKILFAIPTACNKNFKII